MTSTIKIILILAITMPLALPILLYAAAVWYFHSRIKFRLIPKHIVVRKVEDRSGDTIYWLFGRVWKLPVQIKCKGVSENWHKGRWVTSPDKSYSYQMFFDNQEDAHSSIDEICTYLNSSKSVKRDISIGVLKKGNLSGISNRHVVFYCNKTGRTFLSLSKAMEALDRLKAKDEVRQSITYKKKI